MQPVIGIVVCGLDKEKQFVSDAYVKVIEDSGGVPLIIPRILSPALFPCYSALCDGFLFCGGGDISPRLFGEDLLTGKGHTDAHTDQYHLDLMKHVLSTSLPVLAICRGMQLLNVALGGTIYQDISLREGMSQNHMQISENREDVSHRVAFSQNSLLYRICGSHLETNSYHHQCIHDPGKGLRITGMTADGIAESLESPERNFCVGVQWHPEHMYHTSLPMRQLFSIFITQAKNAKTILIPVDFS